MIALLLLSMGGAIGFLAIVAFFESDRSESSQRFVVRDSSHKNVFVGADRPLHKNTWEVRGAHLPKWRSGTTSVSGLSDDEQRILCGVAGATPTAIASKLRAARFADRHATLQEQQHPRAVQGIDRRSEGYVSAIRNQGRCGSCVAFGTLAAVECCVRWKYQRRDMIVKLSPSHLFFDYGRATGASCKDGWHMEPAFDALMRGVADESDFMYEDTDRTYQRPDTNLEPEWREQAIRATSWDTADGRQEIQNAIDTHGAVAGVMVVYRDFMSYQEGIYAPTTDRVVGLHAIAIVGYNQAQRYWICQNSWGEDWGQRGFFWIAYGTCGIDDRAWFPTGTEFVQPNQKRNYFTRDMRYRPPDYLTGRKHQHKRSGSRVAEDCPECRSRIL